MRYVYIVLILFIGIGVGIGGSIVYTRYIGNSVQDRQGKSEHLVGNDSDEHGCKGSAGYTWCEEKQKCLRVWEEPCITEKSTTGDIEEVIISDISKALIQKHGDSAKNIQITVSKVEGLYAVGGAKEEMGGGMWLAAKVEDEWKLVWDGNGTIGCALLAQYDYPASIVPECWNEETGTSIAR